jgi:hypothetical protein
MKNRDSVVATIQDKLPTTKLFLQKKFGPHFDWQSFALTATSVGDPTKTFTMTFDDGFGKDPLNDDATSFVDNALLVLNRQG